MAESTLNSAYITPEELHGLLDDIDEILSGGDSVKINNVLNRLTTYNGLEPKIVQDFNDAIKLRSLLQPGEYLTDVDRGAALDDGDGAFGRVYKGTWKGQQVAVKKFCPVEPPEHIEHIEGYRDKFIQRVEPLASLRREVDQWKSVSTHDPGNHVWPLWGITMWLDRDAANVVYALVSPLAQCNLKFKYVAWLSLTPKKFANYFHDAATGLKFLHSRPVPVIHGDIHPKNILLNEERCYLVDFGISKSLGPSTSFSFASVVSEVNPVPELTDGSSTPRNQKTDIFSFGSTMYRVLAYEWKELPMDQKTGYPVRPKKRVGQGWDDIWNLILWCMSKDPTNRPPADQLVEALQSIKARLNA